MKKKIFDICVVLLLFAVSAVAQPTIPTPNNPPASGSGSSGAPFVVCAGSTSTFYVLVNEDSEAGDIELNDFEWRVYGGTIQSALSGNFAATPTTNLDGGQNYSVATQSAIDNTAVQDSAKITIQWDATGFTGGWIAVKQSSEFNCSDGTWALYYVNVGNVPAVPVSGGDQSFCTGDAVATISATVGAGETVDWYAAATGGTPLLEGNTSYTPSGAGTYYAEAKNTTSNCVSATRVAITVTENSVSAGSIGSNQTVCSAAVPAAFTSTGTGTGTGGVTYQWQQSTTSGTTGFTDIAGATATTYTPTTGVTQDTWFRREATSLTGGCVAYTAAIKVTVESVVPGSIAGAQTICSGTVPTAFANTVAGTGTYQWQQSTTSGTTGFTDISGATNAAYTPASALTQTTWFRRKANSGSGTCDVYSNVIEITVNNIPTIAKGIPTNPTTCSGNGTIPLTFTNVPDGSYTINYDGGSFSGVSVAGNAATVSTGAGVYNNLSITVSGCTSTQDVDVVLTDPAIPTIALGTPTNPTTCSGNGTIPLTFTNVPDGSYTINYDGGSFSGVSVAGNAATVSTGAGVYNNLSITLNGCTSAEDVDVALTDPPTPTIALSSSTGPTTCSGTDGSISLSFTNVAQGNTYTVNYVGGGGTVASFTNVSVDVSGNATISNLSAGTYNNLSITVSGCTSAQDVDVTLTDPPIPTVTIGAIVNPTTCGGTGTIPLTFTNVADGDYTINYTGGSFAGVTVTGGTASITTATAGTYSNLSVTVNGCTGTAATSATLTDPTAPIGTYTVTGANLCAGGTVSVSIGGSENGVNYQLREGTTNVGAAVAGTGGAITIDVTPATTTTYNILATNTTTLCTTELTNTATVTINAIDGGTIEAAQTICSGDDPDRLTSSGGASGTGTGALTYQWEESTNGTIFNIVTVPDEVLAPVDDAFVDLSRPDEALGSTTSDRLVIKKEGGIDREIVLKFDLSSIENRVESARLRLCLKVIEGRSSDVSSGVTIQALEGDRDDWNESTVTWNNNRPLPVGSVLSSVFFNSSSALAYYEWDVTSLVASGVTSDNIITIVLRTTEEKDVRVKFDSKENASDHPQLVVSTSATMENYNPPPLTSDRWYRRMATSTYNTTSMCNDSSNAVKISVNDITPGSIGGDQMVCSGSSPTTLTNATTATGSGTITYQWQSSTTSASAGFADISGATTATYSPGALTQATWFKRIAISTLNTKECSAESNVVAVGINPIPDAPVKVSDISYCIGSAISDIMVNVNAGETVDWYSTATGGTPLESSSASYSPTGAGTYYAEARISATGCVSNTREAVVVTENPLPTALAGTTTPTVCAGGTVSFTETGGDATSWLWDGPDDFSSTLQNPTISNAQAIASGTYTVTVTDGNGCTSTASQVTIGIEDSGEPKIFATETIENKVCDTNGSISLDVTHPVSFTHADNDKIEINGLHLNNLNQFTMEGWVKFNYNDILITEHYSLFGQKNGIEFGFYPNRELRVNTQNGSGITSVIPREMGDGTWHHIALVATSTSMSLYLDGNFYDSESQALGGGAYTSRTDNNITIGGDVIDGVANSSLQGKIRKVGFWNRALSAAELTTVMTTPYEGTETGLIAGYNFYEGTGTTISAVGSNPVDGNFVASPTWDNLTYAWTRAGDGTYSASTKDITSLVDDTYTLTVSEPGACSAEYTYTVSYESPVITATATVNNSITCAGTDITFSSSASGGTGSYTYTWSGPDGFTSSEQNPTITGMTTAKAGTYTVTATDTNGCYGSETVSVTVNTFNLTLYDVTNATNVNTSTDVTLQTQCPELANGFDGNTASYNAGATQVIYRVDMAGSADAWQFTFTLSGTDVSVSSFVSYTGVGGSGTITVTGTGNTRTISVPAGNTGVVIRVNISNEPGSSLSVVGTVSNGSSSTCTGETSATDDNTRTHTINRMPDIGSIN